MKRRRALTCLGLGLGSASIRSGAQALPVGPTPRAPARGDLVSWPLVHRLDGRVVEAPAASGQAAVLVFFSTTCIYCLRHNPRMQKLADAGVGLPLQVLGVAHAQHADDVRRHLARHGLRLAVTLDERPLHQALSPRHITPLTVVLDRAGRLQEVIPGEMTEDDVMGLLRWART